MAELIENEVTRRVLAGTATDLEIRLGVEVAGLRARCAESERQLEETIAYRRMEDEILRQERAEERRWNAAYAPR